jgi:hypothetical protein
VKTIDNDDNFTPSPLWRGGLAGYSATAIAHHVTARLVADRSIAVSPLDLRLASEIIFRYGERRGLIAHRFADTHLHAILTGDRRAAGVFVRCAESELRKQLRISVAFEGARIRPIETVRHLSYGVRYAFTQETHHGTSFDPAHDGSSLPELLGMRVRSSGIAVRFRAALPRIQRAMLIEWLGFPAIDDVDAVVDVSLIADSCSAAFGLADLHGFGARHESARRTAVHLLARIAPNESAASWLAISSRSACRYRAAEVVALELRAAERQLRLRTMLRGKETRDIA